MFWLNFLIIVSTGLDVSYLSLTSVTNPSSATISLTYGTASDQSYSVEFWMRPVFPSTDIGTYTVVANANGWNALYYVQDQSVTFTYNSQDYCRISSVSLNYWTHIVATYSKENSQTFSCYRNSTLIAAFPSAPTSNKSPAALVIGGTFYGGVHDLRAWPGKVLSQYEIQKNYTTYFVSPFPQSLNKYYRLIQGTKTTTVLESIGGTTQTIASTFKTPWINESPGSLILCSPGYYTSGSNCNQCPSSCAFCKNTQSSTCYNTSRRFIDFSNTGLTDTVKLTFPSTTLTLEFWFFPSAWNTNTELFSVYNLINIKQRGSSNIVSFYDGAKNEVYNFTAEVQKWVHVAWVLTSSKAVIYMNSTASPSLAWSSFTPDTIMYLGSNSTARFQGIITDLRMWKTSRTKTQILSYMYQNITNITSETDLLKYCPLNESSITIKCSDKSSSTFASLSKAIRTQDCTTENCLFECPLVYYFNTSLGECFPCDSSCQACSGPSSSNCTVCLATDYTIPGVNSCYKSACPTGYVAQGLICQTSCNTGYYNSSGFCTICNSNCTACTNATYCTSCNLGYTLYPGTTTSSCIQDCGTALYVTSSLACAACSIGCGSCYGTSTNCTACATGKLLYSNTCVSTCPLYTFQNGTNCFDCHKSCYNCTGTSSSECITCKTNYNYTDNLGICYDICPSYYNSTSMKCLDACPDHTYPLSTMQCGFCDNSCVSCNGPLSSNCTACPEVLYNNTCLAVCPSHSYKNLTNCFECSTSCTTCSMVSTNCTSCSSPNSYYYLSTCNSVCPSNTLTLESNKSCVTTCPKGYIQINSSCVSCDSNCLACTTNTTTCTECPSNQFLYNSTCVNTCPSGYYPLGSNCVVCGPNCNTCSDYNFCTSCKNSVLFVDPSIGTCNTTCNTTTYTQQQSCLSSCTRGYYPVENPKKCLNCPSGCTDCTSGTVCQACNSTSYFLGTLCVSSCPSTNFYPNTTGMYCGSCDPTCVSCNGNTIANCTVCSGAKVVYVNPAGVGECVSACPTGYYLNGTMCNQCLGACKTCTNNSTCSTCITGYYLKSDKSCALTCASGDLVNTANNSCIPYSKISPTGYIDLASFAMIQITYPITVTKGSGNITIFSVINSVYSPVATYYMMYGSTISLGTSLGTSITASVLSYGTNYTIEYSAGSISSAFGYNTIIPRGTWNFTTNSFQLSALVVIINNGNRGAEFIKGETLPVDASKSYDPSSGYKTNTLYGVWNCFDFTASYTEYSKGISTSWADYIQTVSINDPSQGQCSFWNYTGPPTTSIIILSGLETTSQVLRLTYTLSDSNSRSTTADIFIIVVPSAFVPVTLASPPLYKINTDKIFQLQVDAPMFSNSSSYKWSCISSGSTPVYLTSPSSWVLSVAANSMSVNTVYTFSITYSDAISKTSAVISITTNSPPISGVLSIDKTTGTGIVDYFTAQMIGWTDPDLPLTYSFFMLRGVSNIGVIISGLQTSSVIVSNYPGGNITLIGYCYDALGSRAGSAVKFNVTSLHDTVQLASLFTNLPSIIDESNVYTALPMINAFAVEFNYSYSDTKTILGYKTTLLTLLTQAKSAADNMYTRSQDINSLYIYASIIGILNNLVMNPVSISVVNSTMILANSINYNRLALKQQIYPISNSSISATSPQSTFRLEEQKNTTGAMGNMINLVSNFANSSLFTTEITALINNMNTVLGTGSIVTETQKSLVLDSMTMITSKNLLTSYEKTNITISTGVQVTIPNGVSTYVNNTSVNMLVAFVNTNPYYDTSTVLKQYLLVEMKDADTDEAISVQDLDDPFLISFNITRSQLDEMRNLISASLGDSSIIWPECTYWDFSTSTWSGEGCSLSNIGDIYSYFEYVDIPDYIPLICSCNHLSQFSVKFTAAQSSISSAFIINDENVTVFSSKTWETTIVLYLMISGLITLLVLMSLAFYWDNYNPGLSLPSVETERTFRYWDPNKVVAVLAQLEKEFIKQLTESGKGEKKDTTAAISKILNSGLVHKLMLENSKDLKENYAEHQREGRPHPVETLMKHDPDEENIHSRTKRYLEKGLEDPRHMPTIVSEPKPRGNSSRKDLENTIAQLKLHMNHLETNTNIKTPIDLFLEQYDESEKLPPALKSKLKLDNRDLKKSDLKTLGINSSEFLAMRTSKSGKIVADSNLLTGGKYCK